MPIGSYCESTVTDRSAHPASPIEAIHQQLEAIFDAIQAPVFAHDAEFRILRVNRAYAELAGRDFGEIIGRPYWQVFPSGDGPLPGCRQESDPGSARTRTEEFIHDGRHYRSEADIVRDGDGDLVFAVHVLTDISDRVAAEQRRASALGWLQAQLALYREPMPTEKSLVDNALEACVAATDSHIGYLHFFHADEETIELYAWNRATLAECEVEVDSHYPLSKAGVWADCVRQRRPVIHNDYEHLVERRGLPKGHFRVRRHMSVPVFDQAGRIRAVLGVGNSARDYVDEDAQQLLVYARQLWELIDHRRDQSRLRQAQAIVENSPVMVFRWRAAADWPVVYVSENIREFGYAPEALLSGRLSYAELIHPEDRARVMAEVKAHEAAGRDSFSQSYRLRAGDGAFHWVDDRSFVERDADGRISHYQGILLDISERRRHERALHTLSRGNSILIHSGDEQELLQRTCDLLAGEAGYQLAWVGYRQDDADKSIRVMASSGEGRDYLRGFRVGWGDDAYGRGPSGVAVKTGRPQVYHLDVPRSDIDFDIWREAAVSQGFVAHMVLPLRDNEGRSFGVLALYSRQPEVFDARENALLEELANDLAYGIQARRIRAHRDRLAREQRETAKRTRANLFAMIDAMAEAMARRDPYTAGHQLRVAQLARAIATDMGMDADCIQGLELAARIHDIGKIYVPAEIINRPGRLSPAEFEIIKTHAEVGYEIMKGIVFPWPLAEVIYQHHERLDGSGYPRGLKDAAIIPKARILMVADVVEAVSAHRPYRPALGMDKALEIIVAGSGTQFDAQVVEACTRVIREQGFQFRKR